MSTIDFVRGRVVERAVDSVVIDTGPLGYRLLVASATAAAMPESGAEAMLYTHLQVREDAWTLYGFATRDERGLFNQLLTVTGVGPKVALAALSAAPVERLAAMIEAEDFRALARVPGIGQKTAQRIVLDLKGKITGMTPRPAGAVAPVDVGVAYPASARELALAGLRDLGFSQVEAEGAVAALPTESELTAEETILHALQRLGSRR